MIKSLTRLIYHEHHRPRTPEEDEHLGANPATLLRQQLVSHDPDKTKHVLRDAATAASSARLRGGNSYNIAEAVFESKMELQWITDHINDLDLPDQEAFNQSVQRAVLERVDEHKPLAYVLGSQPFLGCDIVCKEPLLIPRTETEEWVLWLTQQYLHPVEDFNYPDTPAARQRRVRQFHGKDEKHLSEPMHLRRGKSAEVEKMRVLDLCCGTGCIGAALLRQFDWIEVVGVDADERACETAFENYYSAARLGVRQRVQRAESEATDKRREERKQLAKFSEEKDFFNDEDGEEQDREQEDEPITSALPKEERIMRRLQQKADALERKVDEEHERVNKGRISVVQSDMFRDIPEILKKRSDGRGTGFDLIVCNPPYLMPEEWEMTAPSVKRYESRKALVGDERHEAEPLSYFRELRDEAPKWLCQKRPTTYLGPRLMAEVGIQARFLEQLFAENKKWKKTVIHCDRFDVPRWMETGF